MKKINKRLLLSLGMAAAVSAPVATVVACGDAGTKVLSVSDEQKRINAVTSNASNVSVTYSVTPVVTATAFTDEIGEAYGLGDLNILSDTYTYTYTTSIDVSSIGTSNRSNITITVASDAASTVTPAAISFGPIREVVNAPALSLSDFDVTQQVGTTPGSIELKDGGVDIPLWMTLQFSIGVEKNIGYNTASQKQWLSEIPTGIIVVFDFVSKDPIKLITPTTFTITITTDASGTQPDTPDVQKTDVEKLTEEQEKINNLTVSDSVLTLNYNTNDGSYNDINVRTSHLFTYGLLAEDFNFIDFRYYITVVTDSTHFTAADNTSTFTIRVSLTSDTTVTSTTPPSPISFLPKKVSVALSKSNFEVVNSTSVLPSSGSIKLIANSIPSEFKVQLDDGTGTFTDFTQSTSLTQGTYKFRLAAVGATQKYEYSNTQEYSVVVTEDTVQVDETVALNAEQDKIKSLMSIPLNVSVDFTNAEVSDWTTLTSTILNSYGINANLKTSSFKYEYKSMKNTVDGKWYIEIRVGSLTTNVVSTLNPSSTSFAPKKVEVDLTGFDLVLANFDATVDSGANDGSISISSSFTLPTGTKLQYFDQFASVTEFTDFPSGGITGLGRAPVDLKLVAASDEFVVVNGNTLRITW